MKILACPCGAACTDGAFTCDRCAADLTGTLVAGRGNLSDTGKTYAVGSVLGSYRLLQQIGGGGMGRVFVAEHIRLGRKVALKVLRSEFSENPEAVKRFFAEARAVNCISHENIIEVSDFVESPRGPNFYIMELLRGVDLGELQSGAGVLPLPRALRIAIQVCSALGAAHAAGIVHRDLKPDNIFLAERAGRQDFVKLLDFGVAKLMTGTVDDASTFRSSVGMVVGTPDYMAPEQAMGYSANHLVDVYAMGVILFEMVAGRRPFVAKTAREVMVQHLTMPPPSPRQLNPAQAIPAPLEELILACLSKEPEGRPASIQEVERRLRAILEALPAGHPAPVPPRATKPGPRRSKAALALAAMMLLAAAGVVFAARNGGPVPPGSAMAAIATPPSRSPAAHPPFTVVDETRAPGPGRVLAATPPSAMAPVTTPPTPSMLSPAAAPVASDDDRRASRQARPGLQKPAARPASSRPGTPTDSTEPPPLSERRRVKLDRGAVLNPFE